MIHEEIHRNRSNRWTKYFFVIAIHNLAALFFVCCLLD